MAGFHSLVGLAALSTSYGDFLHNMDHMGDLTGFHLSSVFMGAWMGSITLTGSIIACGKLAELWRYGILFDSAPLQLPGRDFINGGLAGGVLAPAALGVHMTASIGGADMPVVITLLNSYSGWALCAEGFILNQPLLTVVGALIGSSGAFLTKIMCDGMNRDLVGVIAGGFGGEVAAPQGDGEILEHTEIFPDGMVEALLNANHVGIVPGYGLAVARAQHAEILCRVNMCLSRAQCYPGGAPQKLRGPGQVRGG